MPFARQCRADLSLSAAAAAHRLISVGGGARFSATAWCPDSNFNSKYLLHTFTFCHLPCVWQVDMAKSPLKLFK
jgi:hypothetical protein